MSEDKKEKIGIGEMHELAIAAVKVGHTSDSLTSLTQNKKLLGDILLCMQGLAEIKHVDFIIDCDADPCTPYDLKVLEHKRGGLMSWNIKDLNSNIILYRSEKQRDVKHTDTYDLREGLISSWGKISEADLQKELEGMPVLNANVLDYLLRHPQICPKEWNGNTIIYFWGTIYIDGNNGKRHVRYLVKDGRYLRDGTHCIDSGIGLISRHYAAIHGNKK